MIEPKVSERPTIGVFSDVRAVYFMAYADGQNDMIARLAGRVPADEDPEAPIATECRDLFRLWCFVHNLAIAGALHLAVDKERDDRAADARWENA